MAIGALAALAREDVYYLICGKGALREELQEYADQLGVGGRIRMPGYSDNMPWIYRNADIFVFPSVREGMPVAVMEAMAAGLACVVSDIRGCRELISGARTGQAAADYPAYHGPGGFRFSLGQPKQLEKALAILIDSKTLRQACGRHNQKKISDYDQELVQENMKGIYAAMELDNRIPRGHVCLAHCPRK